MQPSDLPPEPAPFDQTVARFLQGFARQAGIVPALLDEPGTTVVAQDARAGTGAAVLYLAGRGAVVLTDPDVADEVRALIDRTESIDPATSIEPDEFARLVEGAGFAPVATADMRVLARHSPPATPPEGPYHLRQLQAARPDHVDLVRALADRCDPVEVEEAALDELDDFAETAIHVLVDDGPEGEHLVAYASACDWDWDPDFADIGVLVADDHRRRGLGRHVVARTVADLLAAGRVPLYRHERSNAGSAAIAAGLGFEPATSLFFHRRVTPDTEPTEGDG